MVILGIETSCDETAAAVIEGVGDKIRVLANVVSSQIEIHQKYGGVVPEVAAREHVLNILPVVNEALAKANARTLCGLMRTHAGKRFVYVWGVDAIAVTIGPGLITSLMVGVETAKTLAYAWQVPAIGINHIEGHIYANWLKPISEISNFQFPISKQIRNSKSKIQNCIKFPAVVLTVSGGHTMLVLMKGHGKYKVLGETRDDAAGEAFDKAAQLLGIGYPGGPAIAAEAAKLRITPSSRAQAEGNYELRISKLPRPMINDKSYDFSFSGLKTALLYEIKKDSEWQQRIPEYAAEFQQAVVDVLSAKTIRAAGEYKVKAVMLAGGVAANKLLRQQLALTIKEKLAKVNFIMPELKYCTDNAAMIAAAGYFQAKRKNFTAWQKLKTDANIDLK